MKRNKLRTAVEIVMEKFEFPSIKSKVDYVIKQLGRKESNVWGRTQIYKTKGIIFTASYSRWNWNFSNYGDEIRSSVGKKSLSQFPDDVSVEIRRDDELITVYHDSGIDERYDQHIPGKWEGILDKLYITTKRKREEEKANESEVTNVLDKLTSR